MLFGRRRFRPGPMLKAEDITLNPRTPTAPAMAADEGNPVGVAPRRQGLFGRMGQNFRAVPLDRRLAMLSAALRDEGNLDQTIQGFIEQDALAEQQRAQQEELAYARAQRQRQDEARATIRGALTPQDAARFEVDPSGYFGRQDYLFEQDEADRRAPARAQVQNESALYQRGYRPDGSRFGPAADDWAINQAQLGIARANAMTSRMNASAQQSPQTTRINQSILDASFIGQQQATELANMVRRFGALNAAQPTGLATRYNPGSYLGASSDRRQEMEALTSSMVSMIRTMRGEGGVFTDSDAARMERGLPSVDRGGVANQNLSGAFEQAARNAQDQFEFFSAAHEAGASLNSARETWAQYTRANPIFDASGNLRVNRPGFGAWLEAGRPDLSQTRSAAPMQGDGNRNRDPLGIR